MALAAIERERADWEALLAEVGEARMLEPGAMGDWTFKDLAAHLTGLRGHILCCLEDAACGRPELPLAWQSDRDSDAMITAWLFEIHHQRALSDILAESRASYARLAEAVANLPDETLTDPGRFACLDGRSRAATVISGAFFAHLHVEHEPEVRRWLVTH
jgi:hypothetical protein